MTFGSIELPAKKTVIPKEVSTMPTKPPPGIWARFRQGLSDGASDPPSGTVTLLLRSTAVLVVVLWLLDRASGWLAVVLTLMALSTWSQSWSTKGTTDASPSTPAKLPEDSNEAATNRSSPTQSPARRESLQALKKGSPSHNQVTGPTVQDSRSPRLPETFSFEYCDAEGSITHRTVVIRSAGISAGRRRYLSGTCTQAHAQRTFRLDRISGWLERTSDGVLFDARTVYKAAGPPEAVETNPTNFKRSSPATSPRPWQPAVVFAGFSAAKREELEGLAEAAGWQVRTSISKTVNYLVAGGMVGSRQIDRAGEFGVQLLDEDGFRMLV